VPALLLGVPAFGEEGENTTDESTVEVNSEPPDWAFSIRSDWGYRFQQTPLFPIDIEGSDSGQGAFIHQRITVAPEVSWNDWTFRSEVMFFEGILAGDTSSAGALLAEEHEFTDAWRTRRDGRTWSAPKLRQAYLRMVEPWGELTVGQTTSHWGLGIVANSADRGTGEFSGTQYGDIVHRIMWRGMPFLHQKDAGWMKHLFAAVAWDVVWDDEQATLLDGDLATQGVVSLGYSSPSLFAGVYSAFRYQKEDDGDSLTAFVVDMSLRIEQEWTDWLSFWAALEAVALVGETNRVVKESSPEKVDLMGVGVATELGLSFYDDLASLILYSGYASGDRDPNDGTLRTFSFDRSYHVGMILFEDVLAMMTARAADRVVDPNVKAVPPEGIEGLPSGGAIQNAIYVHPVVRVRPLSPLTLKAGFLWAYAPAPLMDPLQTSLAGGVPTSYFGAKDAKGALGMELEGGIEWKLQYEEERAFVLGAQYGVFFPGEALEAADGTGFDKVNKARVYANWSF